MRRRDFLWLYLVTPSILGYRLLGYADGNGHVISSESDLKDYLILNPELSVSQSTMFTHEFKNLSEILRQKYPELVILDTICGATKERQSDLVQLVEQGADAIVVIDENILPILKVGQIGIQL